MNKSKLLRLADDLDAQLPKNFHWDFQEYYTAAARCDTVGCALGLEIFLRGSWPGPAYDYFNIPRDRCWHIFFAQVIYGTDSMAEVTPHDVSRVLRYYVEHEVFPQEMEQRYKDWGHDHSMVELAFVLGRSQDET